MNDLMWVWWAATVIICAWKLGEGFLRPYRMLEWPFVACAMWAYFYGYMAYDAKVNLPQYLGGGISNIGQLMPLLCLVGLLLGWKLGTLAKVRRPSERAAQPYFKFWLAGFFFLVVGVVGGFSVLVALRNQTIDYQDSSAYWYLIFYVGYPGLTITLWALCRMNFPMRRFLWVITILALIAFMFPHVINARRGPLFPAIMILLLVPPLARKRSPHPFIFFGSIAVGGLVMLLFLQIRPVLYDGGSWGQAINHLSLNTALEERTKQAEDNEYINNCQVIGTIYQNGKYQYGTGHLGLLFHWVPRSIWKDKPVLGEGYYSFDEMFDDVEAVTGFHLLGNGAATGGVADTFVQYGILCPLFWFGISWGLGIIYVKARKGNRPRWLFFYVGFICASHWLVSQSFAAAFVPAMAFVFVPLVVLVLLDRAPSRAGLARRDRPRDGDYRAPGQLISP